MRGSDARRLMHTHTHLKSIIPEAFANVSKKWLDVRHELKGHTEAHEAKEKDQHLPEAQENVDEVAGIFHNHELLEAVEVTGYDEAGVRRNIRLPPTYNRYKKPIEWRRKKTG